MTPPISVEHILSLHLSNLDHAQGSRQAVATGLSTSQRPTRGSLVFVSTTLELKRALETGAHIVIAARKALIGDLNVSGDQCVLSVESIPESMSGILPFWDDKKYRTAQGISAAAFISTSSRIGKDVSIGPFAVVGDGVLIGDGCTISPHVTIERDAVIGAQTYIHPNVMIGARCQVGERCEIHSGTVIGSDGYGYWSSKDLKHHKIPQVGIVVLEDDVEIGANCTIDRATLTETRIGRGTKFDNLIHFAHNCSVGKNSRITAGFMTAGSTHIGDNFLTGGVCQVADHITITDNVILAGRSGVTKDIEKGGAYGGYPLEPLKDAMKTIANIANLTLMRKQIHQIRKHLGLIDSENP